MENQGLLITQIGRYLENEVNSACNSLNIDKNLKINNLKNYFGPDNNGMCHGLAILYGYAQVHNNIEYIREIEQKIRFWDGVTEFSEDMDNIPLIIIYELRDCYQGRRCYYGKDADYQDKFV